MWPNRLVTWQDARSTGQGCATKQVLHRQKQGDPNMANNIGEMIAASCSLGVMYAERLLSDMPAAEFARYARPGGQVVTSNHPAFNFGHLCLYSLRIVKNLDGDLSAASVPDNYPCLFSKDATCQDDPDGTIYPAMDVITEKFFAGYRATIDALRATNDETFMQVNPEEGRLRELFPTMGAMHTFYVGGHMMTHLGQTSAWRRMIGLGAA